MLAFWIVFGLLALNTIASLHWISKALAILRERYEPVWSELGRPSLFWNNSPQNVVALQGFLWSERAAALGDSELDALARRVRAATVLQVLLLPVAALSMFVGASF